MQAPSVTNTALALTLTIAGAFPVAAQMAVDVKRCEAIKDPVKSAQCVDDYMKASIAHSKARIAAAEARIAAEDALRPCLLFLKSKKDAGTTLPAVTSGNACSVAQSLGMKPTP